MLRFHGAMPVQRLDKRLFCCRHRHRLYLHSFPTRRSSDLPRLPSVEPQGAHHLDAAGPAGGEQRGGDRDDERDRKSTRLNSSHRCNSYAVFCLKKKNKSRTTNQSSQIIATLSELKATARKR